MLPSLDRFPKMSGFSKILLGVVLITFSFAGASRVFAEKERDYDPYTSVLKYPDALQPEAAEHRDQDQFIARILEQPLRPVGYGLGKTAEWVERNHVDDKTIWLFDELESHGIFPGLTSPTTGSLGTIGLKGRVEMEKLFQIEQPFAYLDAFGGWTPNKDFAGSTVELGSHYKIEVPTTSFTHEGKVRYWRSSAESFYGIGQDTSLGEYSTYQPEELIFDGSLGYQLTQAVANLTSFVYQRVNIGNGNRERVGKIKEHFPVASIPGIDGGDLIGLKTALTHDSRDQAGDPKHGGHETIEFSYFHDTDGNDFHYLKIAGSASRFIPIRSDRRILALRLAAEKNQELGGDEIPFFNLSRLGGSDRSDGSELLRSYRYNRFFEEGLLLANVEYRYSIYEYGNFRGDAVALFDVGEVFEEIGDFGFDELKFSYGGGLNLQFRHRTIFAITVARGNEGWRSGVHTKASF